MNLPDVNYRERVEAAMTLIDGGALLVMSMPEVPRWVGSGYRQDSFLHYLTGFDEPESALLLFAGRGQAPKAIAFVREKDPVKELWEGARLGVVQARRTLPVDEAYPIGDLWERLPSLLKGADRIFYDLGADLMNDRCFVACVGQEKRLRGRHSFAHRIPIHDVNAVAGRLRVVKAPEEIARMRQAANITAQAFDVVFHEARPGMSERQVHGILVGEFLKGGAEMEGYRSIVASGASACCLHYSENDKPLNDGDLLLIDAGCQFEYYNADVSRTFPIGSAFSKAQKSVYEAVLAVQENGISLARAGNTMQYIHQQTCEKITEALIDLGLLKGSISENLESFAFRKYFPHGTGHWLGMDVHDVGNYTEVNGEAVPLQPGMVFTVEPGIYIPPHDESAPKAFRGIGVRIEDDVLVTSSDPEVLTEEIPKTVGQLEGRY